MVIESEHPPIHVRYPNDLAFIRAYVEAQSWREQWQAGIDQVVRDILGLATDQPLDLATVPSAAEIRAGISQTIPHDKKLSDMIVTMREESG
jgi:hypothetical protein